MIIKLSSNTRLVTISLKKMDSFIINLPDDSSPDSSDDSITDTASETECQFLGIDWKL